MLNVAVVTVNEPT